MKMKKWKTAAAVLFTTALTVLPVFESGRSVFASESARSEIEWWSSKEKEESVYGEANTDSLLLYKTTYNTDGTLQCKEAYAYDFQGNLMFVTKTDGESEYEYVSELYQYTDTGKNVFRRTFMYDVYDTFSLETYDVEKGLTHKEDYTNNWGIITRRSTYELEYLENQVAAVSGTFEYVYDRNGNLQEIWQTQDGNVVKRQERTYDEHGNLVRVIHFSEETGEETKRIVYSYDLNEYGQPVSAVVTENDESYRIEYEYFPLLPDDENQGHVGELYGYWIGEHRGRKNFLCIGIGFLCYGYMHNQLGIPIIGSQGIYDVDRMEIMEEGTVWVEMFDQRSEKWYDGYVDIQIDGDHMIIDGREYFRVY